MTTTKPTESLEAFLQKFMYKSYKKGEIIVFQGEAPRSAYIVRAGVVKLYNLNSNGEEKPVGFHAKHDVFPEPWTFYKAPSAVYYYEAFTDVKLYIVPRDEYIAFLKNNPERLYQKLEKLVVESLGDTMRLNALQHSRASDKLVYTLHYLALSHGHEVSPGVREISLDLTHQDFANLTGLTRETSATELNKLKNLGVISYGKRTLYKVKIKELNKILNDQFIAEMQLAEQEI